jgi:hypothetical protein
MALAHQRVTVTSTATLLSSSSAGRDGQTLLIQNPTGNSVLYLGASDVTTSSYGYALPANADMSISLQNGESLYGATAVSSTVNIIRQGV